MNKKIKFSVGLILGVVTLFSLFAFATPASAQYAVPECTAATLNGYIEISGGSTQVWFEWGPGSSIIYSTPKQTFSSNSNFSQRITGLTENTTYSYRAMSTNSIGSTISFTTKTCSQPTPPPTVTVTADTRNVDYNGSTTIRWSSNADFCQATGGTNGWSNVSAKGNSPQTISGSFPTGSLTNTTTYSMTCSNSNGQQVSDSDTVSVGSQPAQTYTVSANAGPGGTISPSSKTVTSGSTTTFSVTPNSGYSINSTSGCGGYLSGNTYTTGAITSNCTVYANFSANPAQTYTVSTNAGSGGTISPSSRQVTSGNSTTFSVTPNSGYSINSTSGCGGWLSGNTYTTGAITSNCTVYANFSANPAQTCQDPSAINYGGALPCNYQSLQPSVTLTADSTNIAFNGSTLLRWTSSNATSCTTSGGTNGWSGQQSINNTWGWHTGALTNTTTYNITCTSSTGQQAFDSKTVFVGSQPTAQRCLDVSASNYNSIGSCVYPQQRCLDQSATNYNSIGSCVYVQRCLDVNAINYNNIGSCVYRTITTSNQPTVAIFADSTSIAFNGATTVRWGSTNATSCFANGGSTGWAGTKSIGPGSFFTGSLTRSATYTITCSNNVGSATDSVVVNVRGQVLGTTTKVVAARPAQTALVLVTSSVDRNQPIVPTLDNTNPCPGDEINYTLTYQNIGTGSVTNLVLRLDLPSEVDYMFSNPNNPTRSGNTLIFNLGTLRANGEGTVTVRVRVRNNIPAGMQLNFPATLSYVDPSGFSQSVNANISAQVCGTLLVVQDDTNRVLLGANIFGSGGFMPGNIFGWLLLLILILLLILLAKYIFGQPRQPAAPYVLQSAAPAPNHPKKTTTTTVEEH